MLRMTETVPLLTRWRQRLDASPCASSPRPRRGDLPLPPEALVLRVNAADKADPAVFMRSGLADLAAIVRLLQEASAALPESPAVMELGCGVGRLLRHVPRDVGRLVGTDIKADCLEWCRRFLPHAEFHLHECVPPIASLADGSFDLAYANSVFTHIPLERQRPWIAELRRLVRAGGWLAITLLGPTHADAMLDATQRATLASGGAVQIHPELPPGADTPVAFGAVFQARAHLAASVRGLFEIAGLAERAGTQSVAVMRAV
jgi:SAM-dependent methyltransferase